MSERQIDATVARHARKFRAAFETVMPEHPLRPPFPRGWCTMASMLLGEYLREVGLGDFQTRSGILRTAEPSQTHAWLERDGLIVDITADQFPDTDKAVIVSRDSPWHREWSPAAGSCIASLAYYQGDDCEDLVRDVYARLVAAVTAS